MPTTSDRVRSLVDESGLTYAEFAERVGLDGSKLSKSLGGTRRFTSLDLARVAEVTSTTVDWLLTGREAELATAARAHGGSAGAALREARRLAGLREDVAFLGFEQPWRPLSARAGASAATLASAARRRLAESDAGVDDLAAAVEEAFGVDVVVTDVGERFDGLAVSSDDSKLILLSRSQLPARQRFTLAHELGHLLSGDDQQLHVDEDVHANRRDPTEMRANTFAAALLMPADALRATAGTNGLTEQTFADLACTLVVSPSALAYRLLNLRLIDAGTCDSFRAMSAAKAATLAGSGQQLARQIVAASEPRIPGLLARDAYAAYETGLATIRPYANVIGIDPNQLRDQLEIADNSVSGR